MRRLKKLFVMYTWEILCICGGMVLFIVLALYFNLGFNNKTPFIQSVLPNFFADVIGILVTTFLVSKLVEMKLKYKEKEEFRRVLYMEHLKHLDAFEIEYLKILTSSDGSDGFSRLFLNDVNNYLCDKKIDYFREEIKVYGVTKQRAAMINDMNDRKKKELEKYLNTYSSIMPMYYQKKLIELKLAIDNNIVSNTIIENFGIESFLKSNKVFVQTLDEIINYFNDPNLLEKASQQSNRYGWDFIIFSSLLFILSMIFIYIINIL